MNIVEFIRSILTNYNSLPNLLNIQINKKVYPFFEGISIIDCNQYSNDRYTIIKRKSNKKINILEKQKSLFNFIDALENLVNSKDLKYKYYLNDTTKTSFCMDVNIPYKLFKEAYHNLIKQNISEMFQYVICFTEGIKYQHFFNEYFKETYPYEKVLIKSDMKKPSEKYPNYILIKLCHDVITITEEEITFKKKDSYDFILQILPLFHISRNDTFIQFNSSIVSFNYPISINYQLFNLMLYQYGLHLNIYTNENERLLANQEKAVYTIRIYNTTVLMNMYNNWKQFKEVIHLPDLEWYMYKTIEIVLNYLYLLYIDFHIEKMKKLPLLNVPIKINYNRLFFKYYTRYFNNENRVLPVLADKDYCDENNIKYVQWNGNYYMAPLNSGYTITIVFNEKIADDGIPKCVTVIRKYTEKRGVTYSNLTYKLNEYSRGIFPSTLFIPYRLQVFNLFRVAIDITDPLIEFKSCPICKTYLKLPSQKDLIKVIKTKIRNSKYFEKELSSVEDVNVLGLSVDIIPKLYPYAVSNYTYNYNSSFPFVVIMLNTTKLYTFPNYRYEFIISSSSSLHHLNDEFVSAIFTLYKAHKISIVDNDCLKEFIGQYVVENNKTVLIAEKNIENSKRYLWYSTYLNLIPKVPIIESHQLESLLPELSDLYQCIDNITAYHYNSISNEEKNDKVIMFGVWSGDIYYPCTATTVSYKSDMIKNIPYLLINRNMDGSIFSSNKNNSDFLIF